MNFKKIALGTLSRILRYAGILLLIYVSMVFYLALTERRNAFPRAISHKEAREAIQKTARHISCTTEDGAILEGWSSGDTKAAQLLYFPDADEDAAQFLAELGTPTDFLAAAFNYRGSGDNKGTPSQETFEPDAKSIVECATQINGSAPKFIAGRGTGALLAAKQINAQNQIILIDPVTSIADAISDKYRVLYPKFLIRANVALPIEILQRHPDQVSILADRAKNDKRTEAVVQITTKSKFLKRTTENLDEMLSKAINIK